MKTIRLDSIKGLLPKKVNASCNDKRMIMNKEIYDSTIEEIGQRELIVEVCLKCKGRGWDLIKPIGNDKLLDCPDCKGLGVILRAKQSEGGK